MSTRSNIKISIAGENPIWIYRHWDGYPAEVGADILNIVNLSLCKMGGHYLANKFFDLREKESGRRHYELTADIHGDIDHLYEIVFAPGTTEPYFRHVERARVSSPIYENPTALSGPPMDRAGMVDVVNGDRRGINRRLAELRTENPKQYGECEDYPFVAA